MRAKADFWLGIALCVGAIWIVVGAGNQWSGHLVGGGLALAGVAIALRNVDHFDADIEIAGVPGQPPRSLQVVAAVPASCLVNDEG